MTFVDVFARRVGLSLVAALVVQATSVNVVLAQDTPRPAPTAADFESARELFRRGKELRANGQVDDALVKFEAAHTYGQTPITGLELGRTHLQLGHMIEAREVLLSVARLKITADESDNSAQARREAQELAEQIRTRLARVTVTVGQAPRTIVTLDGVAIPVIAGSVERVVNPGRHVLTARIGAGRSKTTELVLAEGESRALDLTPSPDPSAVAAGPEPRAEPAPPSAVTSSSARPSGVHPLVYIGFGTALAGLTVGTITGIVALNKGNAADALCNPAGGTICTDATAQAAAEDAQRTGRSVAVVSTVSFVLAGAGALAGVVGLLLPVGDAQSARRAPAIRPIVGLGYAGVGGHF